MTILRPIAMFKEAAEEYSGWVTGWDGSTTGGGYLENIPGTFVSAGPESVAASILIGANESSGWASSNSQAMANGGTVTVKGSVTYVSGTGPLDVAIASYNSGNWTNESTNDSTSGAGSFDLTLDVDDNYTDAIIVVVLQGNNSAVVTFTEITYNAP